MTLSKEWKDGKTGGTIIDAASLKDLESRIQDEINTRRVMVPWNSKTEEWPTDPEGIEGYRDYFGPVEAGEPPTMASGDTWLQY